MSVWNCLLFSISWQIIQYDVFTKMEFFSLHLLFHSEGNMSLKNTCHVYFLFSLFEQARVWKISAEILLHIRNTKWPWCWFHWTKILCWFLNNVKELNTKIIVQCNRCWNSSGKLLFFRKSNYKRAGRPYLLGTVYGKLMFNLFTGSTSLSS